MTTKPKTRKKVGRPSGFDKIDLRLVKMYAERGWTDKDMSEAFDVTERTWNNWKVAHPEFFLSLKNWKDEADARVERSLFERATGYTCKETKTASVDGKITDSKEVDKHYPPDTTAMIFWLKNRKPDEWRDKRELDVTQNIDDMTEDEVDAAIAELKAEAEASGSSSA